MAAPISKWRITLRLKAVLGTEDDLVALGYGCFLWGALLRCTWVLLDLFASEGIDALLPLLILLAGATLFTLPLTDLAGAVLAFRRARETRLILMTCAAAAYWSRGLLAPEYCGAPPATSEWIAQFCEQAGRSALGLVLLAVCLDRMWFSSCLPGWLRMMALAGVAAWMHRILGGNDHLEKAWAALSAAAHAGDMKYAQVHEPIRTLLDLGGTLAWGVLAILGALAALCLLMRKIRDRGQPRDS